MSESGFNETCKVALFGANSTGKTLQIRSLIEAYGWERVGIVSCEDGLKVIRSSIRPEQVKECNNVKDLRAAFKWASENYYGLDKWVCVDGGTRALEWIAGTIWAGTEAVFNNIAFEIPRDEWPKEIRTFLRFITEKGNIDGQRQWIEIGRSADFELDRWVKLPANTYWTFWEDLTSKGQFDKGKPYTADAPGKGAKDAIYRAFDFILRLTRDGESMIATHDPDRREVRSKARDDWNGGVKVSSDNRDFNLAKFVETLKPQTVEAR